MDEDDLQKFQTRVAANPGITGVDGYWAYRQGQQVVGLVIAHVTLDKSAIESTNRRLTRAYRAAIGASGHVTATTVDGTRVTWIHVGTTGFAAWYRADGQNVVYAPQSADLAPFVHAYIASN